MLRHVRSPMQVAGAPGQASCGWGEVCGRSHPVEPAVLPTRHDGGTCELKISSRWSPIDRIERPLGGGFVRVTDDDEFGRLWTSCSVRLPDRQALPRPSECVASTPASHDGPSSGSHRRSAWAPLLNAADVDHFAAGGGAATNVNAVPTVDKLRHLADLASSGELRIHVQAVYPLDQVGDAFAAFQQGTRGKLVVELGAEPAAG